MAEATTSSEFLTFQRSYESLCSLSSGIESLSITAYAQGLINRDLRNKCLDKKLSEEERIRCFLKFMEQKILSQPETFHQLVKIIEDTSGLEFIAKTLLAKLEEAKHELKQESPPITTSQHDQLDQIKYSRETNVLHQTMSTMRLSHLQPFSSHEEGRYLAGTPPPVITQRPVDQKKRTSEPFMRSHLVFPKLPPFYDLQTMAPATRAPEGRPNQEEATDSIAETHKPQGSSVSSESDEYFTPPEFHSQKSSASSKEAIEEDTPQNSYQNYIDQQNTIARLRDEIGNLKTQNEQQVKSLREELYQQLVKFTELEDKFTHYIFKLQYENSFLKQQLAHKYTFGDQLSSSSRPQNFTHLSMEDQHLLEKYIQELEKENQDLKSKLEHEKTEKQQVLRRYIHRVHLSKGSTQSPYAQPTYPPSRTTRPADYHYPTTEARLETGRQNAGEYRGETTEYAYH